MVGERGVVVAYVTKEIRSPCGLWKWARFIIFLAQVIED